jgi:hypothetical protein
LPTNASFPGFHHKLVWFDRLRDWLAKLDDWPLAAVPAGDASDHTPRECPRAGRGAAKGAISRGPARGTGVARGRRGDG